jgi:putative chitobiose transport system substrate-binding protein
VDVRWVDVQFQAIEQKLLAAIAGRVPPDVVNLNVEFTVRIAEKGALLDMDAAVPAAERAKYFEGLWTSSRFRGRSYGIPWYIAPPVLIYHTDLFQ